MKNRIITNSNRTIKKSLPRFISIIIMSFLGVMVYTGLQATSPDMLHTLDNYLDEANVYDIKIISSKGLVEEDIETLRNISNIKNIEGTYSKDIAITKNEEQIVINVSSLPSDINKIDLIDGRLPIKDNEIVVEENLLTKEDYKIGDILSLNDEDFINQEVTIVGTINSHIYFNNTKVNQNRGTTSIGTGSINYYSYMLPSNFNQSYYTYIYLTINNANEKVTSKDDYNKLIDDVTNSIEKIKTTQEESRFESIYNEANNKIIEEETKALNELKKAENELNNAKKDLNTAKKQLDSTKTQLSAFKIELDKAKKELNKGKNEFENALKEYNIDLTTIDTSISYLEENIKSIENILPSLDDSSIEYQQYTEQLNILKNNLTQLITLKNTNQELTKGEESYNTNYSLYKSSYQKYTSGLSTYNKGLKDYNEGLKDYNDSKEKVEKEFTDAKNDLNKLEKPIWYIYDRNDDQTYSSYINQTKSIKNLSGVFPVVFYAVAVLVSLISMNRMVEDDRGEIGTLKSLGFSNNDIRKKYLIFSLLATLIGGLLGTILGLTGIPYLIFIIYRLLFILPNFYMGLNVDICIIGILIAIICICGASVITTNKVLKEKPATLMRPKAPVSGKKILLERIKIVWNNLKFSQKITIRNIFRYKKRVFVTIFGICGCTALMLCGFGIKDSIVDITNMQYKETFKFDATVYTNNLNIEEAPNIFNDKNITDYIISEQISATLNESNVTMLITDSNESLSKVINLKNHETKSSVSLEENKVVITDKLADIHNIKIGDNISILDSDKNSYTLKVSSIVNNYIGHYIYMDKNTLESLNKEYKPNVVYLKTTNLTDKEKEKLSESLIKNDQIVNVINTDVLVDSTKDMLDSLDKIIIVLIVLSASLAFVVLYNLSNININERKREIATLKVLGFYNSEVDSYITKENIILTIIGITFGLIFGSFLTNVTIGTVEMENTRFLREVSTMSYIYTSIITFVFTLIVNFVTHFTLKKIDMIESLKSVE